MYEQEYCFKCTSECPEVCARSCPYNLTRYTMDQKLANALHEALEYDRQKLQGMGADPGPRLDDMGPNMQRMDGSLAHDLRSPEHRAKVAENEGRRAVYHGEQAPPDPNWHPGRIEPARYPDRCWNTGIEDESSKGLIDQALAGMFAIEKEYPGVVDEPITPKAAKRKIFSLLLSYFPDALEEVCLASEYGAMKYAPGAWREVPIDEFKEAAGRHMVELGKGRILDIEPEQRGHQSLYHWAQVAWNALAVLQKMMNE